ncbi:hypothetical protein CDAR_524691 [Caerostris darwini]|uniref:Uncharacterized protein n=1 Tax=Caerostris darwini TaxID=1538125 RepID=A0AAV4QWI6_9ARAC|nr:hypothetical protein CDAR_524691 [Caerostris darwini]
MTAFFLHSEKRIQHTQRVVKGRASGELSRPPPTEERGAPIHVKIAQTKKESSAEWVIVPAVCSPGLNPLALLLILSGIQWRENDLAESGRPWRSTHVAKMLLADERAKVGCLIPKPSSIRATLGHAIFPAKMSRLIAGSTLSPPYVGCACSDLAGVITTEEKRDRFRC